MSPLARHTQLPVLPQRAYQRRDLVSVSDREPMATHGSIDRALRRAVPADAATVHALLEGFAARGLLLPRTPEQVAAMILDFVVVADGRRILGCGALRVHSSGAAEICALAVTADAHGRGIGRAIVERLVEDARHLRVHRVFALTLQNAFFHRLGFETVSISEFPEKIASDCVACARRSSCVEIAVARRLDPPLLPERRA